MVNIYIDRLCKLFIGNNRYFSKILLEDILNIVGLVCGIGLWGWFVGLVCGVGLHFLLAGPTLAFSCRGLKICVSCRPPLLLYLIGACFEKLVSGLLLSSCFSRPSRSHKIQA